MDAASRVINYISISNEAGETPVVRITKGVILGESKNNILAQHLLYKPAKLFFKSEAFQSGYQVKDEQSNKTWVTSELYKNTGIRKTEGDTTEYYQLKGHSYAEKYGYRLPFAWELEKWKELEKKYVLSETSKERYVHILDGEKKKKLASSILKEINGEKFAKKKDIENLCEKFEDWQIKKDKSTRPFFFNMNRLSQFCVERSGRLETLKEKFYSKSQEIEMSRMALINGEYGTGKSELAKSYAYSRESDNTSSAWKNVVWIDAKSYADLSNSFYSLDEELESSIEGSKNNARKEKIESIIKNVYKHFQNVESLFIFDNASNYEEIKKFLPPSNLVFGRKKPYVLITSRNKDWKEEIEKIELNDGFSLGEAITFIERTLGIKDKSQNRYLSELAEALNYLPLALAQATAYIKQEELSISKYLEHYNEAMQESNPDCLEAQGISKELFTTLKVNFDKIRGEKNIGQQSCNILCCMAYLDPNQIDIEEIFLQKKSKKDKQQVSDALTLLNKFSMIKLEESIAKIHRGVQNTIRVEKEQAGTEEETLREIMTSFYLTNANHVKSVWSHVSKHSKLVNEFIDSIYDGSTILHLLAKDGNEEVIKLILEKVDIKKLSEVINAVDEENLTALDYAAMNGHLEIVKYFIGKGSDLSKSDFTPLHWAAMYGQSEIVKHFINNKYFKVDQLDTEDYETPLHYAIIQDHLDIVLYLVEKGANVNYDGGSMYPLHCAAKNGHLDIVEYLTEKVVSINLQDEDGMSPLHYAVNKNAYLDIVKYLVENLTITHKSKNGEKAAILLIQLSIINRSMV